MPFSGTAVSASRTIRLVSIAVALAAVSVSLWLAGWATETSLLIFSGLMVGATTFVPLPADTFVLSAAANDSALALGVVGGLINAVVVLVEREWVTILMDSPRFERFKDFFGTNRFVAWTERNMFLALVVGGATFLPFEPFRLVAVVTRYSTIKYFFATLIGRGGRYYALASAGAALSEVGFLKQAIWITLALFLFGLWRSGVKLVRGSQGATSEPGDRGHDPGEGGA